MKVFNWENVKITNSDNCDHCQKPFNQNELNDNRNGASGFMYWFCKDCLILLKEKIKCK